MDGYIDGWIYICIQPSIYPSIHENAEKMGFDLLKIEISKIRLRHLKRLEKVY